MRALLLALAALSACAHAPRSRYPGLEIRLVALEGGEQVAQWNDPAPLAVDKSALFTGGDFEAVEASRAGGDDRKTPALWLRFTPEAKARFEDATTRYTGRRFAVLIGGKVATAPKILHPVSIGAFEVTGPTDAQIEEMARAARR